MAGGEAVGLGRGGDRGRKGAQGGERGRMGGSRYVALLVGGIGCRRCMWEERRRGCCGRPLYTGIYIGVADWFRRPRRPLLQGCRIPGMVLSAGARIHPTLLVHHRNGSARALSLWVSHPAPNPWVELGSTQGVVWCGMVWCGVVWCGVVWCGVVWCGVVWCGVFSQAFYCKNKPSVATRNCGPPPNWQAARLSQTSERHTAGQHNQTCAWGMRLGCFGVLPLLCRRHLTNS